MLESFMEDLLWKYPADFFPRHGFKQAARQFSLSEAGRLDISFRDATERLWVVEVKAIAISTEVADQVHRYAQKLREDHPQDPPIPAVVAPVINATVRDHFDRWAVEHFEIPEATFRLLAAEHGEAEPQPPGGVSATVAPLARSPGAVPARSRGRVKCGSFRTSLGYARYCYSGMCSHCNYRGCECPHHSGGTADPNIIRNCSEWEATGVKWWMSACCQLVQHDNCHNPERCGCRCHFR